MLDGNCDISIQLDEPGAAVYEAGDVLSGKVIVEVSDDVTCNGLDLSVQWQTRGRGNRDGASPVTCEESLTVPDDAPFSFDSHDNSIIWRANVHIDVPGWPDWEHQTQLLVGPDGAEAEWTATTQSQTDARTSATGDTAAGTSGTENDDLDLDETPADDDSPEIQW